MKCILKIIFQFKSLLRPDPSRNLAFGRVSPGDEATLRIYDKLIRELNESKPIIIKWNKANEPNFLMGAGKGALMGGLVGFRFGPIGLAVCSIGGSIIGGISSILNE